MALAKENGRLDACYGTNHNFYPNTGSLCKLARRVRPQRLGNEDFSVLGRKWEKKRNQ